MPKTLAIFCLGAALSTTALAQGSPSGASQPEISGSTPVAYVYVSSSPGNGQPNVVVGYSANANGALTPVPGSPFNEDAYSMAGNGKYLMAVDGSSPPNIDTLRIESDGALTSVTSTSCVQPGDTCLTAGNLFFDHTGSDLYVMEYDEDTNDLTASFAVDKSSGTLNYLGNTVTGAFPGDYTGTFFIGNNVFAYSADQSGCMYPAIYGFQREDNGLLNQIDLKFNVPKPPPGVRVYYPDLTVADPTNNLAFLEQPANPPGCAPGPIQIAVYTVGPKGNIHTDSTYKDMPTTLINTPYDMKMSPSGKILAVAGQEGLQLFHFNGASPVTHYTGLVTKEPIIQMFWDNSDHLYAISSNGKLYVGTATPTTLAMAPGSPYSVANPQSVIVQPLTK